MSHLPEIQVFNALVLDSFSTDSTDSTDSRFSANEAPGVSAWRQMFAFDFDELENQNPVTTWELCPRNVWDEHKKQGECPCHSISIETIGIDWIFIGLSHSHGPATQPLRFRLRTPDPLANRAISLRDRVQARKKSKTHKNYVVLNQRFWKVIAQSLFCWSNQHSKITMERTEVQSWFTTAAGDTDRWPGLVVYYISILKI